MCPCLPACSHDSLLVTLVLAAQHKPPATGGALPPPQQQQQQGDEQQHQPQPAGAVLAGSSGPPAAPQLLQLGTPAGDALLEMAEVSPLGPMPLCRAPVDAIALATGELALRAAEERRCRMLAFVAVGAIPGEWLAGSATCRM